jgi:DNA invertase Pin-like site-specific DNA recombinase
VDTFQDNDVSATSGRVRPGYERMMAAIGAGHLRGLVVWDVDRLTRTPRELEDIIDHADRMGLRLASVGGDIDLATEQGRMMARMKGTVARYEVEQSSRRLRRKHAQMAADGRHNGPRPFGWDLVTVQTGDVGKSELRLNKAEAAVIRECVSRVLQGEAIWKLRNDLNRREITTATGGEWQTQTLRRMLLRWRNCGVRTYHGKAAGRGQWEPIINQETHERVVATLTDPSRRTNNRGTAVRYLLTGKALCGVCRRPMVGKCEQTYDVKVPPLRGQTEARRRILDVLGLRVVVEPVGPGNAHRSGPDSLWIAWKVERS